MRAFALLALFVVCSVTAQSEYDSEESAASFASPEMPDTSVSSEEVIDTDQVEIVEGSGSGDEPVVVSVKRINVLGILPGPGDIRKKRAILDALLRK